MGKSTAHILNNYLSIISLHINYNIYLYMGERHKSTMPNCVVYFFQG